MLWNPRRAAQNCHLGKTGDYRFRCVLICCCIIYYKSQHILGGYYYRMLKLCCQLDKVDL